MLLLEVQVGPQVCEFVRKFMGIKLDLPAGDPVKVATAFFTQSARAGVPVDWEPGEPEGIIAPTTEKYPGVTIVWRVLFFQTEGLESVTVRAIPVWEEQRDWWSYQAIRYGRLLLGQ